MATLAICPKIRPLPKHICRGLFSLCCPVGLVDFMKKDPCDNSVHARSFLFLIAHTAEKCHTSLGFPVCRQRCTGEHSSVAIMRCCYWLCLLALCLCTIWERALCVYMRVLDKARTPTSLSQTGAVIRPPLTQFRGVSPIPSRYHQQT